MIDPIDFVRKSSGLYVPPLIGLAVHPLGRFQPCPAGDCCFRTCEDCGDSLRPGVWIDLPSLANGSCINCGSYFGTARLGRSFFCGLDGFILPMCSMDFLLIDYDLASAKSCYLTVTLIRSPPGPGGPYTKWRLELFSPASPVDHVLPFYFENNTECSGVGTTVRVYQ